MIKRIADACVRAFVGAFTGVVVVGLIVLIATNNFGFGAHANLAVLDRIIVRLFSMGAALGAIVAVLFGAAEIRGRAGAVIKGMAFGGLAGVLTGPALGAVAASIMDVSAKSFVALGIFAGLALGVVVGGIVGAALPARPMKKSPARPIGGVGDRTLDG